MARQERLKDAPILIPCPWCGTVPYYVGSDTYRDWGVECQDLKCPVGPELSGKYTIPEEAARDWNQCKTHNFEEWWDTAKKECDCEPDSADMELRKFWAREGFSAAQRNVSKLVHKGRQ